MRIGIAIVMTLLTLTAFAQDEARKLTAEKMSFLEGAWTGTLDYLDYQDNQTRVELQVKAEFRKAGKKIKYQYIYTEPNGEEVKEKGKIKVSKDGRTLQFGDEEYEVANFVLSPKQDRYRVILTREGKDGGKDAILRKSIFLSEDKLMLNKEVRLMEEKGDYFSRNRYFLKKG